MSITQAAKDFGVDVTWAVVKRKEYLTGEIARLRKEADETVLLFSGHGELDRYLLLDTLKFLNNKIQRLENELRYTGKESSGRITQADIERARQHPIENLLPNVRNGKTHCVSGGHTDKHPSMDIRNGFAYCYSCGWHGDAIAVFMKIHGVSFVDAVNQLCGTQKS